MATGNEMNAFLVSLVTNCWGINMVCVHFATIETFLGGIWGRMGNTLELSKLSLSLCFSLSFVAN
jgi:hypothetical protein